MKREYAVICFCIASVILLAGCSLGGDLDAWRAKAIAANETSAGEGNSGSRIEDDPPPAAGSVTGITLNIDTVNGAALPTGITKDTLLQLPAGVVVALSATVSGTNTFNANYSFSLSVQPTSAASGVTLASGILSVDKVVAPGTLITVTAISTGNTSITNSWIFAIADVGPVDPTDVIDYDGRTVVDDEVLAISLFAATSQGGTAGAAPAEMTQGDIWYLSATVFGGAEADLTYTLSLSGEETGKVTLFSGVLTIAADATTDRTFTITATSNGKKKDGTAATVSVEVTIVTAPGAPITAPDVSQFVWKIRNTKGYSIAINAKTTPDGSAPSANGDKRYVIANNEPYAEIDQQDSFAAPGGGNNPKRFRDVTIMYLDAPFVGGSTADWASYGIEARFRITGYRDSAPLFGSQPGDTNGWSAARQGVVMGAFVDPETINPQFDVNGLSIGDDAPDFLGWRITSAGQRRSYGMRETNGYGSESIVGGDPFYGTTTSSAAQELMTQEYVDGGYLPNTNKREAFSDQEYVYRIIRSEPGVYRHDIFNADGTGGTGNNGGLVNTYNRTSGRDAMLDPANPIYFGFIVYGVTVEISDVKILFDGEVLWADPSVASAIPTILTARRVDITSSVSNALVGYEDYNYVIGEAVWPVAGVSLNALVIPASLRNNNVTWSKDTGTSVEIEANGQAGFVYRMPSSTTGVTTIYATPAVGGNRGEYSFYIRGTGDVVIPYTWRFGVDCGLDLAGWENYSVTGNPNRVDASYVNGMNLYATWFPLDTNTANGIRWTASQATWDDGPVGVLQGNGTYNNAPFIEIGNAVGPFTVTVNYVSTGSGNVDRRGLLFIDGVQVAEGEATNQGPDPVSNPLAASAVKCSVTYTYSSTDRVTIGIGQTNSIRIVEVIIE